LVAPATILWIICLALTAPALAQVGPMWLPLAALSPDPRQALRPALRPALRQALRQATRQALQQEHRLEQGLRALAARQELNPDLPRALPPPALLPVPPERRVES
jgi:hypothetical protein